MTHIINAIVYIHSNNIVHRDLKLENVLMNDKNDIHSIKIIDFGLSSKISNDNILHSTCGTPIFMAPEIFVNIMYTKSVDI